ncbi:A/G-specific adenine glycosylase [Tropicibacter naphthalenivorans]|uniref:Adenine DNA glycosylase n=1 Tax=Tropicibacter naphthalenivorans TaxID=441103 RepID=A0A0P1GAB8_9RHOB|nr:A/G-specific adenine glycosylase [Tropicibacter naphthalenivorans]CUH78453.1 putative A/G-specific adenine glycosylase YfhQ [Tropicibacter naphthalenivorans]SMC80537.1 A/G-specific DNA-adenine glycosylase [Tropicibacter naphthalenivorans]
MREIAQAADLLDWYDRHARVLPWRTPPAERLAGVAPDPYRVWLSEIMLQQTTVAAVKDYFLAFTSRWPTVADLAGAEDADVMAAWAGLGYYARARNLLKCARVVTSEHGGVFPRDHATLLSLPGVGPYTAAAISAIAYDDPQTVLDGNVERVMARLHDEHTPLPAAKPVLTDYAAALTPDQRPGDYAQAVMDLGATICTPKRPACGLCPWRPACAAWHNGTAAELPKKSPKKRKPTRQGIAYLARRVDGAWLLERRPDQGLLGGMLGWPGSDWAETPPVEAPPIRAEWKTLPAEARHTFTHFHLILTVKTALVPMERVPDRGEFVPLEEFSPSDLPTVMRKAFDLTRGGA